MANEARNNYFRPGRNARDMQSDVTRRAVVGAASTAVLASAGCVGMLGGDGGPGPEIVEAYAAGVEKLDEAETAWETAEESWEAEEWGPAEGSYDDAEQAFADAATKFGNAAELAAEAGNDDAKTICEDAKAHAGERERAALEMKKATLAMVQGNNGVAEDRRANAQDAVKAAREKDVRSTDALRSALGLDG